MIIFFIIYLFFLCCDRPSLPLHSDSLPSVGCSDSRKRWRKRRPSNLWRCLLFDLSVFCHFKGSDVPPHHSVGALDSLLSLSLSAFYLSHTRSSTSRIHTPFSLTHALCSPLSRAHTNSPSASTNPQMTTWPIKRRWSRSCGGGWRPIAISFGATRACMRGCANSREAQK